MSSQARRHIKTIVAENIQAARRASDLTQSQLAASMDMEAMNISRWERAVVMPTVDNLYKLAAALDRDVTWFYADHDADGVAV